MRKTILFGLLFFLLLLTYVVVIYQRGKYDDTKRENTISGVYDDRIVIGSVAAQSGHAGFFVEYLYGAKAYLEKINSQGGIWGRKIELIAYDDEYNPEKTAYFTQKLINEDKVFSLFHYVGTPTTSKVVPMIEESKIPLLGIGSGAEVFREPFKKYIFNIRPSYHQEVNAFIKGAVEELGLKRIAVLYQYDEYGFDGLKGAEEALQTYGLKPVATANYKRGTENIEEALKVIKDANPEAVVMIAVYRPAAKFITLARQQQFNPIFNTLSFSGSEALAAELGSDGDGVVVTQVVPTVGESELPGVVAYREALDKFFPDRQATFSGLEGYVDAQVLVEGLIKAGRNLTRDSYMQSLEGLSDYSIGMDVPINFSKEQHQGTQKVYMTYIKDGKFHTLTDWKNFKMEVDNRYMR